MDAIGLVMYPKSPRAVTPQQLPRLLERLPAFVSPVLLFVNATPQAVQAALAVAPNALLQFHGDETPQHCEALARPYVRAARVPLGAGAPGFDLLEYASRFASACGLLLDAHVDGYGGSGQTFDWTAFNWSQLPTSVSSRLVLSGGLTPANVTDGVRTVRPSAVDVSSGVEQTGPDGQPVKGLKDPEKIHRFVAAVRAAEPHPTGPHHV